MLDGSAFIPVFVCLPHVWISMHLRQHLIGNRSHHVCIRPPYAERNRPGRIWTKYELVSPESRLGSKSRRHLATKSEDEVISVFWIWRQHHHLGEIWHRKVGIVGEPEARRAASNIRADDPCFRLRAEPGFDLRYRGLP